MTRLRDHLNGLRERGGAAMGLFLTSGFPTPDATLDVLRAADAHADFLELGMPFSDPVAEGLPIQQASERALRQGATMAGTFETAAAFRAGSDTPLVLMGYANPVMRYGVGDFCADAASSGVDGLILPDLPPEEAEELEAAADRHGLSVTHLIAPNTSDGRVRLVDDRSTGFVYAVSVTGLTGSELGAEDATDAYLARARALVEQPLLVGFGISTPEDAARLTRHTDGFIVGSALIRLVEEAWDDPDLTDSQRRGRVTDWARALRDGASAPPEPPAPPTER